MKDTIYRADAIEAARTYFRTQLAESGGEWSDELQEYVFSEEDKRLLTYNKGINAALKALPTADITETETCQRCQELTDTILNRQGEEIERLKSIINVLNKPSVEAVYKPDYSYEADMVRRLKESLSAEAVREISEDCKPLFFGVDYGKLISKGGGE